MIRKMNKRKYWFRLPIMAIVEVSAPSKDDALDMVYDERFEKIEYDEILFDDLEDLND